MPAKPTIYRQPQKSLPPKAVSKEALRLWKKHRDSAGKSDTPPKLKK